MNMFGGSPFGFDLFMTVIPLIVVGGILYVIIKGMTTWMSNNAAPVLIEQAKVLSKRSQTYGGGDTQARTAYFITFELVESGDRLELQVSGKESGLLVEGDRRELTYQGTRYKGFNRKL
ncbi:DUF2500 domain-containing protein [Bacillus pinisoli]|uniref:DUF2500 domain-containing protein n=1 Tax=Bacillus pinisoli TaxID=2901866 RepID=UPI001FF3E2D5|nr:DUF2500 domain-containing protein [Bacillus pinisoli]